MKIENFFSRNARARSIEQKETDPFQEIYDLYEGNHQPRPPEELVKQISEDQALHDEVSKLFADIALARKGSRSVALSAHKLLRAVDLGIRDFEGIKMGRAKGEKLSEISLRHASFPSIHNVSADFSQTDLTNADFTQTQLSGSNLKTAEMHSIQIDGRRIELWDRHLEVDSSLWDMTHTSPAAVDSCGMCEVWNKDIMKESRKNKDYVRRGVLLFQEGAPLGYMKLKGEPSFLAIRTVVNENQEVIFWQGMVYAFTKPLRDALKLQSAHYRKSTSWRRVDVEKMKDLPGVLDEDFPIQRNNLRFIQDPKLYPMMTDLVDRIESGEEPIVDIMDTPVKLNPETLDFHIAE